MAKKSLKILSVKDFVSYLNKTVVAFETKKENEKAKERSLGVTYTPKPLANYIVFNVFKLYLKDIFNLPVISDSKAYFKSFRYNISKNNNLKNELTKKLNTLKILDPACGSGRFLISCAELLFQIYSNLNLGLSDYEIRTTIIKDNLYGIEIDRSALNISKLQLI